MTHPTLLTVSLLATTLFAFGNGVAFGNEPTSLEIKNGDFELGGEEVPGWRNSTSRANTKVQKDTTAVFKWDDSVSHTGKASIYMRNEGPQSAVWSTSATNLKPNTKYRLSVWMKSFISSGRCSIRIKGGLQQQKKNWEETLEISNTGAAEWEQFTLEFTTQDGVHPSATIMLQNHGGNNDEVWFDDVELVEVSE